MTRNDRINAVLYGALWAIWIADAIIITAWGNLGNWDFALACVAWWLAFNAGRKFLAAIRSSPDLVIAGTGCRECDAIVTRSAVQTAYGVTQHHEAGHQ